MHAALPVGRQHECAQLRSNLDHDAPAVVVVEGAPGSGRTHLMRWLVSSVSEPWTLVTEPDHFLTIEESTTIDEFRSQLAALLTPHHRDRGPDSSRSQTNGRLLALVSRSWEVISSRIRSDADLRLQELLDGAGPCVLVIDGFVASERMLAWCTFNFLPTIRRVSSPTKVFITGRTEDLVKLRDHADDSIVVGPLAADAVQLHLSDLMADDEVLLAPGELETYVEVSTSHPAFLRDLERVLTIARDSAR